MLNNLILWVRVTFKIESKDIQLVDTSKLVLNPKNMNSHSKEQIERLQKLIEFQGFRNPIIVSNRTGFVVAGHGRIEAARNIGMSLVPVMYQDFDNEAQEYAYMVSDNAIASWSELDLSAVNTEMLDLGPDFDIDMLGIKDFVIEPIEKFEPQGDEDAVPDVVHPITRNGDLWLLGNHRLLCGDSTMIDDVEKLMNGEKADCYIDPPYGISYKSPSGSGKTKRGDYDVIKGDDADFDPSFFIGFFDRIISWGANHYSDKLSNSAQWLVWDKRDGDAINNNSDCELAWCSFGGSARLFHHKWNGMIKASEKKEKRVHPTQKPIALHEWVFEACKLEKNIFDGFLGSGSTLIACEKTDRKCFGMELDEKYCDVIIKRWEQYTGKKATLELTNQTYEELKVERDGTTV
jgi:DNA modification methylase